MSIKFQTGTYYFPKYHFDLSNSLEEWPWLWNGRGENEIWKYKFVLGPTSQFLPDTTKLALYVAILEFAINNHISYTYDDYNLTVFLQTDEDAMRFKLGFVNKVDV